MKLLFNIRYLTSFGEELILNIIAGDNNSKIERHAMRTLDGENWACEIHKTMRREPHFDYFYSVEKSGRESRREWMSVPHRMDVASSCGACYTMYDCWTDIPDDAMSYSSAFTECVRPRERRPEKVSGYAKLLRLKVRAPQLRAAWRLAITGNDPCLGDWMEPAKWQTVELAPNEWVVSIDASLFARPAIEFKFVVTDGMSRNIIMWENGGNRTMTLPTMRAGDVVTCELPQAEFDIAAWRGAGTVVPVFSLRSEGSFGVGDFGDLKAMTDWVAATGQHVLQLLPVNDTTASKTWTDSYPYNAISIYALHPLYTDLRQLSMLKDAERRAHYEEVRRELNALPQMDYERVEKAKSGYLRELFAQEWPTVGRRATFKRFFEANKSWLIPYAAFCHYRDMYGTASFGNWPDHHSLSDKERADMGNPLKKKYKEVSFWFFVQYNLDTQMRAAHSHAREKHVILKGDIPIGISRDSVEAWIEPRYFNMSGQAGAPPDFFSTNGQNWGFPTYNWDEILRDNCSWWTNRLRKMAEYFDAYRIDHVLGFFRIWEIPVDAVHGLLGQFAPALGMTRQEIEAYGLAFDEELHTNPFVTDGVLEALFAEKAGEVREKYLTARGNGLYRLRHEYDTQRKVEAAFRGKTDAADIEVRDGLYALISDVLFVRDHTDRKKFHPRIAVQNDFVYAAMSETDRTVFDRLYNDYFYRRNNQFWYNGAMSKLPRIIQATDMLACAEDLGMVPECVPWVINKLRIMSLEIQSMPKESGVRFGHLSHNPYLSVCTISTHDMPTLRQWWDEDSARTQEYYGTMLHRGSKAPHPLPGWLAADIVSRHLACPSALCILSLQDWLAVSETRRLPDADAERINIPANPRHYWRYRMHTTIAELMDDGNLNDTIRTLIEENGRMQRP